MTWLGPKQQCQGLNPLIQGHLDKKITQASMFMPFQHLNIWNQEK